MLNYNDYACRQPNNQPREGNHLTGIEIAFIGLLSFVAAVISAVTGMGGGIFLLAASTFILPIYAVVPLNSAFILASQFFRLLSFHRYILWDIGKPFLVGTLIGALVGVHTYALLSEFAISLLLGLTLLGMLWAPPIKLRIPLPLPFIWLGAVHTWLSAVTGLGGLLQGYLLRGRYSRQAVVGTIAGCMFCMSILKIVGYAWVGFDFQPYFQVIAWAVLAGFLGTWAGKRFLSYITDEQFHLVLRWILTLMAVRLFWVAWTLY